MGGKKRRLVTWQPQSGSSVYVLLGFSAQDSSLRDGAAHTEGGSPQPAVNQRPVSMASPNPIQLTVKLHRHSLPEEPRGPLPEAFPGFIPVSSSQFPESM